MAKVIRAFRERYHNYKRYEVGEEYPETDQKRVEYLIREGHLEKPKPKKKGAGKNDADA